MASILEKNRKVKQPVKTREEYAEDALYREVWEDVNNEKTVQFLKKYYKYIIGGIAGILIILSAYQIAMRAYHQKKVALAINYETAIANADARALASIGHNSGSAISDFALFQSYILDKNIENLKYLAENGKNRDLRDLARIHIVSIQGDDMGASDLEKYLSDLDTKKSPYYYMSHLIIAQKYLSVNDRENANKHLDYIINDADAPTSISATAISLR